MTNFKTYEIPATVSMLDTTKVCRSAPSSDDGLRDRENAATFSYE
jgi:hypothetical protein